MQQLEALYSRLRQDGGPNREPLAIRHLLTDAALADTDPDEYEIVSRESPP